MAVTETKGVPAKTTKKQVKQDIIQKLEAALADLKPAMGEKKFNSKIKKAAKLFVQVAAPKKAKAAKEPAKKAAAKKPATVKKAPAPAKKASPKKKTPIVKK